MSSVKVNVNTNKKVAQVYSAIRNHSLHDYGLEYFENILQQEGSIDQEIPKDYNLEFTDYNVLHFAYSFNRHDIFELLLKYKADFTVKNNEGRTVIHRAIEDDNCKFELTRDQFKNDFVSSVLSAHVKENNVTNPSSKYGITHFHAACMTDHVSSVNFFLDNGVSVNEAVDSNSPIFPSWTALHFAARYACLQTTEILLKNGANVNMKNAKGLTPLSLLLERKINGVDWTLRDKVEEMIELFIKHVTGVSKTIITNDNFGLSSLHVACVLKNTNIAASLLEDQSLDVNCSINANSPVYPGYTPLHFAAISNIETVKLLITKGADIEAKDAENTTPFDLCLQRYSVADMHYIISNRIEWKNIMLCDDKTRLLDLVAAMKNSYEFEGFLANIESIEDLSIPADSPLWPGYTVLHLAVVLSEPVTLSIRIKSKLEICLDKGDLITKTDPKGFTPLHLAFYLQKRIVVEKLLQHHLTTENPFDSNNLSHFHIACAARSSSAVERFLRDGVDVNVPVNTTIKWHVMVHHNLDYKPRFFFIVPGSTALHINMASGDAAITRLLLDHGADIYARDSNGFTPIHRLFTSNAEISAILSNFGELQDCVATNGLTYLHVACHRNDDDTIEKLVNSGANVNARVTCESRGIVEKVKEPYMFDRFYDSYGDPTKESLAFLSSYNDFTPLHFCMHTCSPYKSTCLLLARGADIFAKNPHGIITEPLQKCLSSFHIDQIVRMLSDESFHYRLDQQYGINAFHIACYAGNVQLAKMILTLSGRDYINARVRMDSSIWPGYTPLHLVTIKLGVGLNEDDVNLKDLVKLLLENGADIAMKNRDNDTPLHLLDIRHDRPFSESFHAGVLLQAINDFTVNPANSQGVSFFHVACIKKEKSIVEEYLKHGVDVNQAVEHFSNRYSGCTPLHLAAGYSSQSFDDPVSHFETMDLLIKHGADVRARDTLNNTPLHEAARKGTLREVYFEQLLINGADVNAENIYGETALEILLKSGNATQDEINCLLDYGSFINSYNPMTQVGNITCLFPDSSVKKKKALTNNIIQKLIDSEYAVQNDEMGRTLIHNVVAVRGVYIKDYAELIKRLVQRGLDVDLQDKKGRTALHVAAQFGNNQGILGLLRNCADINIVDNKGNVPFHYAFQLPMDDDTYLFHPISAFATHVVKMQRCKLYVNQQNLVLQGKALDMNEIKNNVINNFEHSIGKTKSIKIGLTSLSLYELCFEFDTEMVYPSMPHSVRLEIDQFFEHIHQHKLAELDYILKLKYKIALERVKLIEEATISLNNLIKHQLPELCCLAILRFLSSVNLKNLILAEKLDSV